MMNEALNQVRRDEQKQNNALLKTRMYWLKNRENLKVDEKSRLDKLLQMNLKTSRVYRLKLDLQELWRMSDPEAAHKFLNRWFWRVTHSRLNRFMNSAGQLSDIGMGSSILRVQKFQMGLSKR